MQTLDEKYRTDPSLLSFLKVKLLEPGWAGQLDDAEAAYVADQLTKNKALRTLWHCRAVTHRRKISPEMAKTITEKLSGIGAGQNDGRGPAPMQR